MRALGGELLFANHAEGGALLIVRLRAAEHGVSARTAEDYPI